MTNQKIELHQLAYQETLETTVPEEEFTPDALTAKAKMALATVTTDIDAREQTLDSARKESDTTPILGKWALGTTDNRYNLGGLLGKGGIGKVYIAHDSNLDRDVAVKVLLDEHAAKSPKRESFLREARVTASLEHPSILPVYDVDQTSEGNLYLTMRRFNGSTLQEVINDSVKMNKAHPLIEGLPRKLEIITRICEAVAYAHSKGFIHQDIKPGNIMLGEFGEVILADWGTARKKEDGQAKNKLIGTPAYMSPEQANKKGADERSDVYCIGTTMFHMLTLRHPTWSDKVEEFWDKKHKGIIDPLSDKEKHLIDPALEHVIMKSLAYDPADRFQSVQEFINAIRQYEEDLECTNICRRAEEDLAKGLEKNEYSFFLRSIMGYEHALEIHDDNQPAHDGLNIAKNSYAECALSHGDLDLASEFVQDDNTELKEQIAAERLKRAKLKNKARLLLYSGAAVILIVLSFGSYLLYDYYLHFGRWEIVEEIDFSKGFPEEQLLFGEWDVELEFPENQLQPDGILLKHAKEMIWFRNVEIYGNVRIDLEVTWPEHVDGLEIMINTQRIPPYIWHHVAPGYSCQFGGHQGNHNYISRNPETGRPVLSNGVSHRLTPGIRYKLGFERNGEELALLINNEPIYTMTDLLPLGGEGMSSIGFRRWNTDIIIHSATVRHLSLPRKSSPLVAGDSLASYGKYRGAMNTFLTIAKETDSRSLKEHALAKAYISSSRLGDNAVETQNEIRAEMIRDFPNSPFLALMLELDCINAWKTGEYNTAFTLMNDIFRIKPDTRVVLNILNIKPEGIPDTVNQELIKWAAKTKGMSILDLRGRGITDLKPLAGTGIRILKCGFNKLTSLEGVENIPLEELNIEGNSVTSLKPLKGKKLIKLLIRRTLVEDLSPLEGMTTLKQFTCEQTPVTDLSPFQNLALENLNCSRTGISSLAPVSSHPLRNLRIERTAITDLTPIANIPSLEILEANNCRIKDLPEFSTPKLRKLYLHNCGLSDLSMLKGLNLESLRISRNKITDLSPLGGMPLRYLDVDHTRISDLSPLENMPISELSLKDTPVSDLSILPTLADLIKLDINNTGISDLVSLGRCRKLIELKCEHNQVADMTPLKSLPLRVLSVIYNPLQSLKPFEREHPFDFDFYSPELDWNYVQSIMDQWEQTPVNLFLIRRITLRHILQTRQYGKLKDFAAKAPWGNRYLYVPVHKTITSAADISQKAGGHMATITSPKELDFIEELITDVNLKIDYNCVLNLGLKDPDTWLNGENADFKPPFNTSEESVEWKMIYLKKTGSHWLGYEDKDLPDPFFIEWEAENNSGTGKLDNPQEEDKD